MTTDDIKAHAIPVLLFACMVGVLMGRLFDATLFSAVSASSLGAAGFVVVWFWWEARSRERKREVL
jgi:hypothetical protein